MTVSIQYRLGAESPDPGEGANGQHKRVFLTAGLPIPFLSLAVEELEDASSEKGELGNEGCF